MKPTLLVGDSLLVNRLAYGSAFRNCLFGWCPDPPPIGHLPERGDVVVFRDGASAMLICKRIIGIPGDEIEVLAGRLYLNGERLPSRPGNMFHEIYEAQGQLGYTPLCANADARPGGFCLKPAQVETLPNGVEYDTLQIGMSAADFMAPTVVPPGSYFVMGQ
jgi:signal peptidase I